MDRTDHRTMDLVFPCLKLKPTDQITVLVSSDQFSWASSFDKITKGKLREICGDYVCPNLCFRSKEIRRCRPSIVGIVPGERDEKGKDLSTCRVTHTEKRVLKRSKACSSGLRV